MSRTVSLHRVDSSSPFRRGDRIDGSRSRTRLSLERLEDRTLLSVTPLGDEFQVNPLGEGDQFNAVVARNAAGGFVVAWSSVAQPESDDGGYALLFNAAGEAQGDPIALPFVADDIAMNAAGDFVIVNGTLAQRYNSDGTALGATIDADPTLPDQEASPSSVGIDGEGDFVIAWTRFEGETFETRDFNVFARQVSADGELQGERFQVNTTTDNFHFDPRVAMNAGGDFVISWDRGYDPTAIHAQRYNSAAEPQGDEIVVATTSGEASLVDEVYSSAVAIDDDGDFAVVYGAYYDDEQETDLDLRVVLVRRYSSDGEPLNDAVQVNQATDNRDVPREISATPNGDFVIVWDRFLSNSEIGDEVFARRFLADGTPDGDEVQVNTFTEDSQYSGDVAVDSQGNFVVTWNSDGQDAEGLGVFARLFVVQDLGPTDTIGVYQTDGSGFFLRNANDAGIADLAFNYGAADLEYFPIVGDWNGDGIDTPGLYIPETGSFFLRNSNSGGFADLAFQFGAGGQVGPGPGTTYIPIAGDWNGDGVDTLGLYSPTEGIFRLKNSNTPGFADITFAYAAPAAGLVPLAGKWTEGAVDTIGVYQPASGAFFLRNSNTEGVADLAFQLGAGGANLLPIVGNWDGRQGDSIGVYGIADGAFFLRNTNDSGIADVAFQYGAGGAGLLPITGNWDGAPPVPQPDVPSAVNDSYVTNEDVTLTVTAPGVLINDSDAETAAVQTTTTNGTLTLNSNGSFIYTPNSNFNGTDSFTYRAQGGTGNTDLATVTITVNAVNDSPSAANDTFVTDNAAILTVDAPGVLANDTDAENNALTAVLASGPANGSLTLNPNGSFTYTPNSDFIGDDSFTYRANDGTSASNLATVTITVNDFNNSPIAANDTFDTDNGAILTVDAPGVLDNDIDPDDDPLMAVLASNPANGTLTLSPDGSFTYAPNSGFTGADRFTYRANDGTSASNLATVTITVIGGGPPIIDVGPPIGVVALASIHVDDMPAERASLGLQAQSLGLSLQFANLPGDQLIDVSGDTILIDPDEVDEFLATLPDEVLEALANIDLTPVFDSLEQLAGALDEAELHRPDLDEIIDDLLDGSRGGLSPEELRELLTS